MTIRVTIGVPAGEQYAITVSRDTNGGALGERLGTVLPGQSLDAIFWKENHLVIREISLAEGGQVAPKQLLQESPPAVVVPPTPVQPPPSKPVQASLEDTVNAVLRNKYSDPDYRGQE